MEGAINLNLQRLEALRHRAEAALDDVLQGISKVALLDYPAYGNVGDSLIWLGEVAYLERRSIATVYVSDQASLSADAIDSWRHDPAFAILITGGGNFGTLWPNLHRFRLELMERFSGTRIIQLPQSLYFADDDAIAQTAAALSKHGNFDLMVRDARSLAIANEAFGGRVHLSPDMAFLLPPRAPLVQGEGVFILGRTDHERRDGLIWPVDELRGRWKVRFGDWVRSSSWERLLQSSAKGLARLGWLDQQSLGYRSLLRATAEKRVERGSRMLSRGEFVVSDRLHVHILCLLLGIPHVVVDNANGKLSALRDTWTSEFEGVRFVEAGEPGFPARLLAEVASLSERGREPRAAFA